MALLPCFQYFYIVFFAHKNTPLLFLKIFRKWGVLFMQYSIFSIFCIHKSTNFMHYFIHRLVDFEVSKCYTYCTYEWNCLTLIIILLHNTNYVVFLFLNDQSEILNFFPMLKSSTHDIYSCCFYAAVAQNVCQFCNVLFQSIKCSGK